MINHKDAPQNLHHYLYLFHQTVMMLILSMFHSIDFIILNTLIVLSLNLSLYLFSFSLLFLFILGFIHFIIAFSILIYYILILLIMNSFNFVSCFKIIVIFICQN